LKSRVEKLKPHFYGPYRVIRRVGEVAYELELPEGRKIHNTFHVSYPKMALGHQVTTSINLPPLNEEGNLVLELERIVDVREWRLRRKVIQEYLVVWRGFPAEDVMWEGEQILQLPDLELLEDKQSWEGRDCNVPSQLIITEDDSIAYKTSVGYSQQGKRESKRFIWCQTLK
jgi:hypothetical protein